MKIKKNYSAPRADAILERTMSHYRHSNNRHRKLKRAFTTLAVLIAILTVCCAYAGKVNPSRCLAAPFLTLAFEPMFTVAIVTLLVALLFRRWRTAAVVALGASATLPIVTMHAPLWHTTTSDTPADSTSTFTVMTYNVLGFNFNEPELCSQPSTTMRLILDTNADAVLMQEAHTGGQDVEDFPSVAPYTDELRQTYPYRYCSPDGLALLCKYPFTSHPLGNMQHSRSPVDYSTVQNMHLARVFDVVLPSGETLRLINTRLQSYYLSFGKGFTRVSPDIKPSPLQRMRRSFALRTQGAKELRHELEQLGLEGNVVLCGDFNDVTASHAYRTLRGNNLDDAWIDCGGGYTYTYNRHHLLFRIDHVLYGSGLTPVSVSCPHGGSSDHYPIVATFQLSSNNDDIN